MSIQKVVEELTAKKKAEMAASEPKVSTKPTEMLDHSKFPVITNTVSYAEVVGEPHPDGVERLYPAPPAKWPKEVSDMVPSADPDWVVDHRTAPDTVAAILNGHNMLMVGPTGTGKTTDIREICARIKMPYARVNGAEGMEGADLYGQVQLSNGSTVWVDGPIVPIVKHGGMLAVDEPFKMSPGTLMNLQWLAESKVSGRAIMLYGHPDADSVKLPANDNFRMALCDNARGTGDNMDIYAATNVQDASFINRMAYKIRKDYMEFDTEVAAVCRKFPWVMTGTAQRMVRMAGLLRTSWNQGSIEMPFSFRELETWSMLMAENGGYIHAALMSAYGNLLEDGDERQILTKAYADVGLDS